MVRLPTSVILVLMVTVWPVEVTVESRLIPPLPLPILKVPPLAMVKEPTLPSKLRAERVPLGVMLPVVETASPAGLLLNMAVSPVAGANPPDQLPPVVQALLAVAVQVTGPAAKALPAMPNAERMERRRNFCVFMTN